MANATPCQTPGAIFRTEVRDTYVAVTVWLPQGMSLGLSEPQAATLDTNLHNAVEMVLARYFTEEDPS